MVDAFLADASTPVANLDFTLTRDQLMKLKNAFKPVPFEEFLRLEFFDTGKILVSTVDKGIHSWVHLSTPELDLRGETFQCFYLDRKRINKLADVCDTAIKFQVEDGEMRAKIGTTDLHISLPLYELHPDVSYVPGEVVETKTSEDVAGLTSRCYASKGSGTFMIPTMSLGEKWLYGTTQNVSIVSGGFAKLKTLVPPEFLDYMSNITFTKEDIKFDLAKDEAGANVLVVSSGHVFHKCNISEFEFEDISGLLDEPADGVLILNTQDTISKLQVLSIPLVGQDNATFVMSVEEGDKSVTITVQDEGKRESNDEWACSSVTGAFEAPISLQSYLNTVNALSKEKVKISSRGAALIVEDGVSTNIIIKYL